MRIPSIKKKRHVNRENFPYLSCRMNKLLMYFLHRAKEYHNIYVQPRYILTNNSLIVCSSIIKRKQHIDILQKLANEYYNETKIIVEIKKNGTKNIKISLKGPIPKKDELYGKFYDADFLFRCIERDKLRYHTIRGKKILRKVIKKKNDANDAIYKMRKKRGILHGKNIYIRIFNKAKAIWGRIFDNRWIYKRDIEI